MNETTKKILCYTFTPQVIPRVKALFFSGFSFVAFFMAQIYRSARLLPPHHPYLSPANMGRFGVRHVIFEAAGNLRFQKENIDQIIIFLLLLLGTALLFLQIAMLGLTVFIAPAHALTLPSIFGLPQTFAAYFLVPSATHDLAFVVLDRVFGIPGVGGAASFFTDRAGGTTCVVTGAPCFDIGQSTRVFTPDTIIYTDYVRGASQNLAFPWPYHLALHKVFEWYSMGLLVIAMFIFVYFIAAVVAETALTGTAFGRRFNHVWAPLRIIAAMGALVPLATGLNSVQYILLYAAKWGSGFATNGWIEFSRMATNTGDTLSGGATDTLVATPNAPPINTLLEFFTIVATCRASYETMYYERTQGTPRNQVVIDAYLINPRRTGMTPPTLDTVTYTPAGFANILQYFDYGDIIVRFGELRDTEHQTYDQKVSPLCGEIILPITEIDQATHPGSYEVLRNYMSLIWFLWRSATYYGDITNASGATVSNRSTNCTDTPLCTTFSSGGAGTSWANGCIGINLARRYLPYCSNPNAPLPTSNVLEEMRTTWQTYVNNTINTGVTQQQASTEWAEQVAVLGWGGAAIWYNKIAQLNGSLVGAAYSIPTVRKYPLIMEKIRKQRGMSDSDMDGETRHEVFRGPDNPIIMSDEEEADIGKAMFHAQRLWTDYYAEIQPGGNIIMDVINGIFGTAGLFNMQNNADARIHPLAQLASIGKSIVNSAIQNLGFSAAAGIGGGVMNLLGVHMAGKVGMVASGFITQIAVVGFSIGFVLFYVVPFLPFIYFFFAVGGWVKGIFEAMVGVPLWALAHIRIDGQGLPGDAAIGGYYLVLEVFLRPICILFGFLASITIFAAQAQILHEIWPLVVSNAAGFDVNAAKGLTSTYETGGMTFLRGAIDKFFFTAIYAVVIYMLGTSCFKLIDLVPNHILRWMGASISTFGEQSGDPADNMIRNSYVGSQMVSGQLGSAMSSFKDAAGKGGEAIGALFSRSGR